MAKQFFQKVGSTRIIPISFKILTIFVSLLLLSNFATNFVNLHLSRKQLIDLNNEVMVSQLKDIYSAAGNQYQIFTFTNNREASISAIKATARRNFDQPFSSALAFDKDGKILFCTVNNESREFQKLIEKKSKETNPEKIEELNSKIASYLSDDLQNFTDSQALQTMNEILATGQTDGSINFQTGLGQYFGVYKFQEEWNSYFVRAELRADTMKSNVILLGIVSIIIFVMVVGFLVAGLFMFKKILSSVNKITGSLYEMQNNQKLSTIDLSESPNDDVTYLAASFNALSSTINNLLGIFQKFASKDVVAKAYNEHEIRLEGSQQNLVMLFSDIKSFTYRTETLGNDIIDLLNVHYDKVIHAVHEEKGVIGSIIGDAILAIYGTQQTQNKSLDSLEAAWKITAVTANLRQKMVLRRAEIEKSRSLTEAEERIYQAVLIDIGVGIDGGNVFYGNIGSDEHMTNTVIGDNVNSASRLEGLTRIYHLPVIVSGYIKDEIENSGITSYKFYEIDTVQVKGKTEGKKIYFPMPLEPKSEAAEPNSAVVDPNSAVVEPNFAVVEPVETTFTSENFETYSTALQAYYQGDWSTARKEFKKCGIEAAEVFLERMGNKSAPENWSGIWTMQTK
ncbi:MAG: adenylate/guanylate cyclase domain-containing protein [Treponema sp.]|nr:adenylate/guanylate cyclase domain-containing protein [Candidatus Treponema equifaecale]